MKAGVAAALVLVMLVTIPGCAGRRDELAFGLEDAKHSSGTVRRLMWMLRYRGQEADRPSAILAIYETSPGMTYPLYSWSAYSIVDEEGRLDASGELGEGYWSPPTIFNDSGDTFALFCIVEGGSSTYRHHVLVHLAAEGARQVDIVHPEAALGHLVKDGEHIDRYRGGIEWTSTSQQVTFVFAIWNDGDSSNHPKGGQVDGTMKVERDDTGRPIRLVVDSWRKTEAE